MTKTLKEIVSFLAVWNDHTSKAEKKPRRPLLWNRLQANIDI